MFASASAIASRELGEQAAPVGDQQADRRPRTRPARRLPIRRRRAPSASMCCFLSVRQSRVWTSSPWPRAELADDRVAGDRPATLAVLDRDAFDAAQGERAELAGDACAAGSLGLARHLRQRLRDDERQPLAEADVGEDLELALRAVFLRQRFPALPRDRVGLDLERGERLVEQPLAELPPTPGTACVFRKWRMCERALPVRDEVQPRRIRLARGRR